MLGFWLAVGKSSDRGGVQLASLPMQLRVTGQLCSEVGFLFCAGLHIVTFSDPSLPSRNHFHDLRCLQTARLLCDIADWPWHGTPSSAASQTDAAVCVAAIFEADFFRESDRIIYLCLYFISNLSSLFFLNFRNAAPILLVCGALI